MTAELSASSGQTPATVHLFEPTGYGGIFQHTCQLARDLVRNGHRVVLHTGHEQERVELPGVEVCECSWWPRPIGTVGRFAAMVRKAAIASRLAAWTFPHLLRCASPRAVLHLQGTAAWGGLTLLLLGLAGRFYDRVVYSPHNVFSRVGAVDAALLRIADRIPDAIVVYSHADKLVLRDLGDRVHYSPLIQVVPNPTRQEELNWRREWRADESETVILCAGFIRPDKRIDVLMESARDWPPGRRLAIVGRDRGGWARCDELARLYNLDVAARVEYVELDEFAAAIAAADLVVVPSERASQSGVLALARQLRTPTVAADVGGMSELASRTFSAGSADDLNRAIQAELDTAPRPKELPVDDDAAVNAHLRAYGEIR